MTKKWFMVTFTVVVLSMVMILRHSLPGPVGDVGVTLVEGLDTSLDWIRVMFSFRA
jgi:hypothetical protein